MKRSAYFTLITVIIGAVLASCSSQVNKSSNNNNQAKLQAESPSLQSKLTEEDQDKQDALLNSESKEISETLTPNVYADISVKPAITAGDIQIGVGHTALIMIKAGVAGKFELEGYVTKDFAKEEFISIAIPMDKTGTFKATFVSGKDEKITIATLIVK